ncbi:MAG TPA: LysM peptidoglycan-binding domain-containing protein [Frateuria sp.]|uniref:LysM peptidoglycan-binding domain-containing protein n=1 Tax=Frateuria sp. TaxID=2211372 RepID=UPI002D8096A4|nr:LysM peptidoglycan-binding domain-containing protein [Frateuria sp.]HET6806706.1 LysM peptidoglycan-binding domain-containing protein [Frateuria sp.]
MGYARFAAQGRRLGPWVLAGLLAAGGLGGCAQLTRLKARITGHDKPRVVVTPARAPAKPAAPVDEPPPSSLAAIVNDQLQAGHYAEGEHQLRRYLAAHPDDRAAQAMLRQLTVDPDEALGHASRSYVVRPGDSYSTLAARFLGDGARFLILARYNHATNPSVLRVGQTLRLPASRLSAGTPAEGPVRAAEATATAPADDDAGTAKARRLQDESLALLHKGQRSEALERMDQALDLDPRLPAAGADAQALRKQLVTVYHQRAIVLYRDQQLDQAISLWNRVLAIEPDFEPATVYRARALELKQRLKQF